MTDAILARDGARTTYANKADAWRVRAEAAEARCTALEAEKAQLSSILHDPDIYVEYCDDLMVKRAEFAEAKCTALEQELSEWKALGRDQETRADVAEQRCEALEAVTVEAGVRYEKLESRCEALSKALEDVDAFLKHIEWNDTTSEHDAENLRHQIDVALSTLDPTP